MGNKSERQKLEGEDFPSWKQVQKHEHFLQTDKNNLPPTAKRLSGTLSATTELPDEKTTAG